MKKFILTLAIVLMAAVSASAQVATENAKIFDNTYVKVTGICIIGITII